MNEDRIAEIRKRHEDVAWRYIELPVIYEDRALLLAEDARHRAEVERLKKDLATQQGCCDGAAAQDAHIRREREEHRAEVEKLRSEIERLHKAHQAACEGGDLLRAEIERLRDVLRRVVVYPSGDKAARVAFVSVGCQVSFPLHPQTTWALEVLIEFDQARRKALEGKP